MRAARARRFTRPGMRRRVRNIGPMAISASPRTNEEWDAHRRSAA